MGMIDEYNKRFYIDSTSPSGLRWRENRYNINSCKGRLLAKEGDPVGYLRKDGYYSTYIGNKECLLHRVVWEMENNRELNSDEYIDHIDGIRSNNNISNLRVVSKGDNNRNCWRRTTNQSGKTGVYIHVNKKGTKIYKSWAATWTDGNGVSKVASFSINKYGYDSAYNMACNRRDSEIRKLCGMGFNYTERHGVNES